MTNSRSAVFLALAVLGATCRNAEAQKAGKSSTSIKQPMLSLDFTNNGQHLAATVGQQIEITLGTVGPQQYGTPQISSPAIRLESVELAGPQNPGGPTFVYFFEAAAKGEAQVTVPIINSDNPDSTSRLTFTVVIRVRSDGGKPLALQASARPRTSSASGNFRVPTVGADKIPLTP